MRKRTDRWISIGAGLVAYMGWRFGWGGWTWLAVVVYFGMLVAGEFLLDRLRHSQAAKKKYGFQPSSRKQPRGLRWEEMIRKAGGKCFYCGTRGVTLEADHVFPVSRGGPSLPINLVVACKDCNRKKRDKTGREFVNRPSAEQRERFEAIDALMRERRVPRRDRQAMHRADLKRRANARELCATHRRSVEHERHWRAAAPSWGLLDYKSELPSCVQHRESTTWRCEACAIPVCWRCVGWWNADEQREPPREEPRYICRACVRKGLAPAG